MLKRLAGKFQSQRPPGLVANEFIQRREKTGKFQNCAIRSKQLHAENRKLGASRRQTWGSERQTWASQAQT